MGSAMELRIFVLLQCIIQLFDSTENFTARRGYRYTTLVKNM